ncbi:hypothetical protein PINS_up006467 [Pythium insidiosum]|nr:hypothetical protein PINS_up006467 [Pythium insidiosum]
MLLSRRFLTVTTFVSAGATVLGLATLARVVTYPLPASIVLALALWGLVLLTGLLLRWLWLGRRHAALRRLRTSPSPSSSTPTPPSDFASVVGHPVLILFSQTVPTVAYTLYGYAYASSSAGARSALIFVLPIVKLAVKNTISWSLRDIDDLKPETVSFNVEIFHALFISSSMQLSTTSRRALLSFVAVGLAQTLLLLNDVRLLVSRLRDVRCKIETRPPASPSPSPLPLPSSLPLPAALARSPSPASLTKHLTAAETGTATTTVTLAALLQVAGDLARIDRSVRSNRSMRASTWEAHERSSRGTFCVAPAPAQAFSQASSSSPSPARRQSPSCHASSSASQPPAPEPEPPALSATQTRSPSIEHLVDARPLPRAPSRGSSRVLASTRGSGGRVLGSRGSGGREARAVPTQRLVARALGVLNDKERALLVRKTLQTLYVTEYIALVKYVEVIMPLTFGTWCPCTWYTWSGLRSEVEVDVGTHARLNAASCLALLFHMANRTSFRFLEGIASREQLLDTVKYLVLYATLELAVFLGIALSLWRALGISLPHQLAFVLGTHPVMVQAKFIVWVVFVIHASLVQLGAYTEASMALAV